MTRRQQTHRNLRFRKATQLEAIMPCGDKPVDNLRHLWIKRPTYPQLLKVIPSIHSLGPNAVKTY